MTQQRSEPLRRIVISTSGELFGGVERHVLGVATGLRDRGVQATLILFTEGELAAQARGQGVSVVVLSQSNLRAWGMSGAVAQILQREDVRIAHAHGYKANVICALARRAHTFALVKTEHGLPEPMPGRWYDLARDRLYRTLDRYITRMACSSVCYVTNDLRLHYARAHAGLPTAIVPNGVANLDRSTYPRPPELRKDWFNLGIIGRVDAVKGHHVAIDAIRLPNMPADLHLHIVGSGPEEASLRRLAARLGVENRVHVLGFRRNVYDYLAHCDVLLMPSLHEGLPYTLLEAMSLGTCIVASRTGGLAEVIEDGVSGTLVPPGDAAALADAVRELHGSPLVREQRGRAARALQQTRFTLSAMTQRYLDVYEAALEGQQARLSG